MCGDNYYKQKSYYKYERIDSKRSSVRNIANANTGSSVWRADLHDDQKWITATSFHALP